VKFEDALAARLNIMQLSQQRLNDFLRDHPARLSPGGKERPSLAGAPNGMQAAVMALAVHPTRLLQLLCAQPCCPPANTHTRQPFHTSDLMTPPCFWVAP
jgi:hypothetical protein